jgi:hypothetical protein
MYIFHFCSSFHLQSKALNVNSKNYLWPKCITSNDVYAVNCNGDKTFHIITFLITMNLKKNRACFIPFSTYLEMYFSKLLESTVHGQKIVHYVTLIGQCMQYCLYYKNTLLQHGISSLARFAHGKQNIIFYKMNEFCTCAMQTLSDKRVKFCMSSFDKNFQNYWNFVWGLKLI